MLDFKYLDEVVKLAKDSDSNALAEIFAATSAKQYAFAVGWLKDEFKAQDALQACYANVFMNISRVADGQMAIVYITQCCIDACLDIMATDSGVSPISTMNIEDVTYNLTRVSLLRISESVCLLLRYMCGMSVRQIASLLEMRPISVRGYIKSGRRALSEKV